MRFGGRDGGNVWTQGFKGFEKKLIKPVTLLGLRVSRTHWVSDSVMSGFAMCISVRGWKVGMDLLFHDRNFGISS